jgi:hypothetical protein
MEQVDFGLMGTIIVEGVRRRRWVLIVTLSASRYQFVGPTFTQTEEDLRRPRCRVVILWRRRSAPRRRQRVDMVVRADAQAPTLQKAVAE